MVFRNSQLFSTFLIFALITQWSIPSYAALSDIELYFLLNEIKRNTNNSQASPQTIDYFKTIKYATCHYMVKIQSLRRTAELIERCSSYYNGAPYVIKALSPPATPFQPFPLQVAIDRTQNTLSQAQDDATREVNTKYLEVLNTVKDSLHNGSTRLPRQSRLNKVKVFTKDAAFMGLQMFGIAAREDRDRGDRHSRRRHRHSSRDSGDAILDLILMGTGAVVGTAGAIGFSAAKICEVTRKQGRIAYAKLRGRHAPTQTPEVDTNSLPNTVQAPQMVPNADLSESLQESRLADPDSNLPYAIPIDESDVIRP